ncbi:hypothetical protein N0B44_11235 [Roseibacterium beibuensis]|uniref:Uncharacterized protein n=1 Tax=[Roseibacterium] beibuensis TaxID=1193142 RepID=A0ABP9LFR7_9RHOB|nr:hypothetical protein [Roseibacterium beibuensis]MCS6623488.1 hypothetical protein [Roseibacterium beibuensis]
MFWSLIATLLAGLAGAGIAMLLNRATGRRLPKWITPIFAGGFMLAATIGQEYGWYDNARATLGDVTVIQTREQQAWWQPWTYLRPFTRGFVAYDPSETVEIGEGSGVSVVQIQVMERWQPAIVLPVLVDCGAGARAEITEEVEFAEDGTITGAEWLTVAGDDPILNAVCGGEAATGS